MIEALEYTQPSMFAGREASINAMIAYLRAEMLTFPGGGERFHAIFVCANRNYLGDAGLGRGNDMALAFRMRELFGRALELGASGMIIAHNHPSGICRPSQADIIATRKLLKVAQALDIELVDHLIITHKAVYSMRAGGDL